MIREIVRDEEFLSRKSEPATTEDKQIAIDLLDTLEANKERCVGMAANMIGELKNIIVFSNDGIPTVMFNLNKALIDGGLHPGFTGSAIHSVYIKFQL